MFDIYYYLDNENGKLLKSLLVKLFVELFRVITFRDNNKFIEVEAWNKIELTIAEIKDIIISHYLIKRKSLTYLNRLFQLVHIRY